MRLSTRSNKQWITFGSDWDARICRFFSFFSIYKVPYELTGTCNWVRIKSRIWEIPISDFHWHLMRGQPWRVFFHSVSVLWPRFYVWCFLNCSHFVLNCFLIFVGLLTLLMTECMYVILYLLFTRLFATGNNVTHYRYIQYLTRKY